MPKVGLNSRKKHYRGNPCDGSYSHTGFYSSTENVGVLYIIPANYPKFIISFEKINNITRSSGARLTQENIFSLLVGNSYSEEKIKIISPKQQIESLKEYMGFNMSEIATILLVERPTIYEWLASDNPNLRKINQQRLDKVFSLCEKWQKTELGQVGNFLRKTVVDNKSLYDLFSAEVLDEKLIIKTLSEIEQTILMINQEKEKRSTLLKKNDLSEIDKGRIKKALKTYRSIG